MTAITINAKNRTIELTKTFATASSKFGTDEYNLLQLARKDYPNYKVVTIARKAPKNDKPTFKGLTYAYMEKYILTHDDGEQTVMQEYMELRGISKAGEEVLAESFNYQEIKEGYAGALLRQIIPSVSQGQSRKGLAFLHVRSGTSVLQHASAFLCEGRNTCRSGVVHGEVRACDDATREP